MSNINELYDLTIENEDNTSSILSEVDTARDAWDDKEIYLSLIFNRKDLSAITDNLALYRAYVYNNDFDNSIAQISLLKEYAEKNDHVMGFNFQNIF